MLDAIFVGSSARGFAAAGIFEASPFGFAVGDMARHSFSLHSSIWKPKQLEQSKQTVNRSLQTKREKDKERCTLHLRKWLSLSAFWGLRLSERYNQLQISSIREYKRESDCRREEIFSEKVRKRDIFNREEDKATQRKSKRVLEVERNIRETIGGRRRRRRRRRGLGLFILVYTCL